MAPQLGTLSGTTTPTSTQATVIWDRAYNEHGIFENQLQPSVVPVMEAVERNRHIAAEKERRKRQRIAEQAAARR
jgi:hypothetical protein